VPDDERPAAEAMSRAAEIPGRTMDLAAGWDAVLERATKPDRRPWVFVALALGMALVVSVIAATRTPEPMVVAAPGAKWEQQADGGVHLHEGRVQVERPLDLALESSQVAVLTRSCRFAAEVIPEGTRVTVFEGQAVVRGANGDERVLRAGESALWPSTPSIPAGLEEGAAPPSRVCGEGEPAERLECLGRVSQGEGLEAQVALFELGRLRGRAGNAVGAASAWRASLQRFPEGVFAPEVQLALMVTLAQQHHFGEALAVARAFEASQLEDPRRDDVARLRRQLEWLTR